LGWSLGWTPRSMLWFLLWSLHFPIYEGQLLLLCALVRQIVKEVACSALLLDPHLVHARRVPWEPLACLKDTGQRFPRAHGGTRW
jgi:hypothetical protein